MPILIFILLIVLVAQIGFWDTFAAILGAVGVVILLVLLLILILALTGTWFLRRGRRRF